MPELRAVLFDMYGTLVDIKTDENRDDVFDSLGRFLEYRRVFISGQELRSCISTRSTSSLPEAGKDTPK